MLRSITIDNAMLKWIADKINQEVEKGNKITRSFLSQTIWEYERKGTQ
jgi:polyhydroxyalkanoate synthesis regulator protein